MRLRRRDEILIFIAHFAIEYHCTPPVRVIAHKFHLSPTTIYTHIDRLMAEGRLDRVGGYLRIPGATYTLPASIAKLVADPAAAGISAMGVKSAKSRNRNSFR